jgi:hypothetical protein
MKTVMKAFWHGKRVVVKADRHYRVDGFNRTFRIKIQVEETSLLPECFIKGTSHKANIDIIETVGGLPNYITKILNEAAEREYMRKTTPIEEQLSLF